MKQILSLSLIVSLSGCWSVVYDNRDNSEEDSYELESPKSKFKLPEFETDDNAICFHGDWKCENKVMYCCTDINEWKYFSSCGEDIEVINEFWHYIIYDSVFLGCSESFCKSKAGEVCESDSDCQSNQCLLYKKIYYPMSSKDVYRCLISF